MTVPRHMGSDFRELVEWAKEHGFSYDLTGRDHIVFRRPNTMPVYASQTPSCKYARKKTKGDLRRAIAESEQRLKALQQGEIQP